MSLDMGMLKEIIFLISIFVIQGKYASWKKCYILQDSRNIEEPQMGEEYVNIDKEWLAIHLYEHCIFTNLKFSIILEENNGML